MAPIASESEASSGSQEKGSGYEEDDSGSVQEVLSSKSSGFFQIKDPTIMKDSISTLRKSASSKQQRLRKVQSSYYGSKSVLEEEDETVSELFQSKVTLKNFIHQDKQFITLYLYIQTAFCPGETLASYLYKRDKIDPKMNLKILAQLVEGIIAIHKKKLVHRDLKPENIFFTEEKDIKIGDFGLARELVHICENPTSRASTNKKEKKSQACYACISNKAGTPMYMSQTDEDESKNSVLT